MIKKRIKLNKKTKQALLMPIIQIVKRCDAAGNVLIKVHPLVFADFDSWGTLLSDLAVSIATSLHDNKQINTNNQTREQILETILETQQAEIAVSISRMCVHAPESQK